MNEDSLPEFNFNLLENFLESKYQEKFIKILKNLYRDFLWVYYIKLDKFKEASKELGDLIQHTENV